MPHIMIIERPLRRRFGTYIDMFSPDYKSAERLPWDMNPKSRRFVDLRDGELQISGDLGDGSRWGRRSGRRA